MTLVHFGTEFDQIAEPVTVPVKITVGFGGQVHIVDGVLRSQRAVGRLSMSPAMVGLKVVAGGRPVRVTVRLAADGFTPALLNELQERALSPVALSPFDTRELVIRSQGRTRGAVLLGRRVGEFNYRSTATVRFDLDADEVSDDGLLLVEVGEIVRGSQAAVGIRIDVIDLSAVPAPAAAPAGVVSAQQLIAAGLAGTGVPAVKDSAELTSDAFVVALSGAAPTWTLRANLARPVTPDPLRKKPGPLLPPRPTGTAAPRTRDKAVALGRRKASDAQFKAVQRFRHLVTRLLRVVFFAPVAWLLAAVWFRTGPITATIEPVTGLAPTGAPPVACMVRRMSLRRIAVTAPAGLDGPAIVRLHGRRFLGLRPAWILKSARIGSAER